MSTPTQKIDFTKYPMPRVRHHVSPQVYLPAEQQRITPAWYPPTFNALEWSKVFSNGAPPSVLDIGCGRGGFLLQHALHYPSVNILGVEVRQMLVDWINGVVDGEDLKNVRALWYSVANGLDFLEEHSIDHAVYLFPDPWPKKRHHKRRLFTAQFLDDLLRVLKPDGQLFLASDVPDVFAYQAEVIKEHGKLELRELAPSEWRFDFSTDQQNFCERKGIPYQLMVAERI